MAATPSIQGFDADAVRAGLRLAMQVGLPTVTADQPTFFMPTTITPTGSRVLDGQGVPFDPANQPTRSATDKRQVPCAIEYSDGPGKIENFGVVTPSKVILTLLDEDYTTIQGFSFVVISGQRFNYAFTEPAQGLVDVGVWRIHCRADDES